MKKKVLLPLIAALVPLIAACSSGSIDQKVPTKLSGEPPLCGGVNESDIQNISHMSVTLNTKNSIGCTWIDQSLMMINPQFQFTMYRKSNFLKEAYYDSVGHGTVYPFKFGTVQGLQSVDPSGNICESIVPWSDNFFVWTVALNSAPSSSSTSTCDISDQLVNITISKMR